MQWAFSGTFEITTYKCCPHCAMNEDGECGDIAARGYHRQACEEPRCVGSEET